MKRGEGLVKEFEKQDPLYKQRKSEIVPEKLSRQRRKKPWMSWNGSNIETDRLMHKQQIGKGTLAAL